MARRQYGQVSFADVLLRGAQRKCKRLERLSDMLALITELSIDICFFGPGGSQELRNDEPDPGS